MTKLWVNETKWSSLLARTRALILYISIWIFYFGPVKLPGLSRNGPQSCYRTFSSAWHLGSFSAMLSLSPSLPPFRSVRSCPFPRRARSVREQRLGIEPTRHLAFSLLLSDKRLADLVMYGLLDVSFTWWCTVAHRSNILPIIFKSCNVLWIPLTSSSSRKSMTSTY